MEVEASVAETRAAGGDIECVPIGGEHGLFSKVTVQAQHCWRW